MYKFRVSDECDHVVFSSMNYDTLKNELVFWAGQYARTISFRDDRILIWDPVNERNVGYVMLSK